MFHCIPSPLTWQHIQIPLLHFFSLNWIFYTEASLKIDRSPLLKLYLIKFHLVDQVCTLQELTMPSFQHTFKRVFYTTTTLPIFQFAVLEFELKISLTVTFCIIRYHVVGQVYSLEELKNLTSFNTANDLMLNITVQGPRVTKLLSILSFKNNQSYVWIFIGKLCN